MPKRANTLTVREIQASLDYDPIRGVFTWNRDVGRKVKAGAIAGSYGKDSKCRIQINGKSYLVAVLVWILHYGVLPYGDVWHIDEDFRNNRVENLQDSSADPDGYSSWLPIETAPKDGTHVDLWAIDPMRGTGFRIIECAWVDGQWIETQGENYDRPIGVKATHWMHVPPAPK